MSMPSAIVAVTVDETSAAAIGAASAAPILAFTGPCKARTMPVAAAAAIHASPDTPTSSVLRGRVRLDAHRGDPVRIANGLAAVELVDVLHALDDLAPHRVLAVEEAGIV